MRRVVCSEFGPLAGLTVEEVPDLEALPGQVVVDVAAAGANFVDALMAQAAAELDAGKRLGLYKQGHKIMIDDAGLSPLFNEVNFTLVKPRVRDLIATGMDGALTGDFFLWKTYIGAK